MSEEEAKPLDASEDRGSQKGAGKISNSMHLEEYKIQVDLYKAYTQLSFDITKYFVALNIALAGSLVFGKGGEVKGLIGISISLFAMAFSATSVVAFRKCIKHCAMFRNRAIELEDVLGANTFRRIKVLNAQTRRSFRASRTMSMVLGVAIGAFCFWVLLLACGIPHIPQLSLK